ncbi:MAG TPA: hypothetical protein VK794_11350, partial [Steroidobacteraceae bacterium]|nr:hypothetical protein [Steroidobacteraceae bacterium]
GMDGLQFLGHSVTPSVVIHYLYIGRPLRRPHEAHAPLIVDAGAVLPFAVPFQGFEPITGRRRQIEQNVRRVQLVQFAPGHRLDIHEPRYSVALVQCSRIFALKRLDGHDLYTISKYDMEASGWFVRSAA